MRFWYFNDGKYRVARWLLWVAYFFWLLLIVLGGLLAGWGWRDFVVTHSLDCPCDSVSSCFNPCYLEFGNRFCVEQGLVNQEFLPPCFHAGKSVPWVIDNWLLVFVMIVILFLIINHYLYNKK